MYVRFEDAGLQELLGQLVLLGARQYPLDHHQGFEVVAAQQLYLCHVQLLSQQIPLNEAHITAESYQPLAGLIGSCQAIVVY